MKIALTGAHEGNLRMVKDLLEDHHLTVYDNNVYSRPPIKFKDEDIIVSTFPHRELAQQNFGKPMVIFATNMFEEFLEDLKEVQKQPWCTVVHYGELDTYDPRRFPISPEHQIQHSIKPSRFPDWIGDRNYIVIPNRKATERWSFIAKGVFGREMSLEEFMFQIPYIIPHHLNDADYVDLIIHSKGVFHFSDNPDTLVLFECMAMGAPIVAFDHWNGKESVTGSTIKRYLTHYGTDPVKIRQTFSELMAKPQKVAYPTLPFDEAKKKWNDILAYALSKYAAS